MTPDLKPDLKNVRVPASLLEADFPADKDGLVALDIETADGEISAISLPSGAGQGGKMVLPGLIDSHTHIDKGHIWPRKPNPDGSRLSALATVHEDRTANWSATDVSRRMDFSLRCAYAHGTVALRTHLDSIPPQEEISWPVFEEMRERWADRIELQAVCLIASDRLNDDPWFHSLADRVAAAKGILGVVTLPTEDIDTRLDLIFRAALDRGLNLDFHVDETGDTNARTMENIAEAALRHRFEGDIMVGHCCALSRQPTDVADRIMDKVAQAGLSVVSLPLCNMYLQDRNPAGTTPRWRGVTLLHELAGRGVKVNVASDNTRDPFYAYGDLDLVEVLRESVRIGHLDHPVGTWPRAVCATPAVSMGLERSGMIGVGQPADLILFKARTWTELFARPQSDRLVIRNGKAIDATPPDYAELDDLMEVA
ncbi:MAG: cytosine deaminase [Pseudomonadota bacterium]